MTADQTSNPSRPRADDVLPPPALRYGGRRNRIGFKSVLCPLLPPYVFLRLAARVCPSTWCVCVCSEASTTT